jgi:hypothetical protein
MSYTYYKPQDKTLFCTWSHEWLPPAKHHTISRYLKVPSILEARLFCQANQCQLAHVKVLGVGNAKISVANCDLD